MQIKVYVWLVSTFSAILGLSYIISDDQRFSADAFDVAKQVSPMWGWGLVFLAAAAVIGTGSFRYIKASRWALKALGIVYLFYGASFAINAFSNVHVSFGAAFFYAFLGVLSLFLADDLKEIR